MVALDFFLEEISFLALTKVQLSFLASFRLNLLIWPKMNFVLVLGAENQKRNSFLGQISKFNLKGGQETS